jgi:hypothetical protein
MDAIIAEALKQGVLGFLTAIALWIAWRKDRQVQHLYRRWTVKGDKRAEKYHELGKEMVSTMQDMQHTITQLHHDLGRRMEDLARRTPP